jgi:hypothetical protein
MDGCHFDRVGGEAYPVAAVGGCGWRGAAAVSRLQQRASESKQRTGAFSSTVAPFSPFLHPNESVFLVTSDDDLSLLIALSLSVPYGSGCI